MVERLQAASRGFGSFGLFMICRPPMNTLNQKQACPHRSKTATPPPPPNKTQVGTPIAVPSKGGLELGRIASMELNHKAVDTVR